MDHDRVLYELRGFHPVWNQTNPSRRLARGSLQSNEANIGGMNEDVVDLALVS